MIFFTILLLLLTNAYLLLPFNQERVWIEWNNTVTRRHSLGYESINIGKKVKLMENSQASKHNRVFAGLVAAPDSTVGGETMTGVGL